jgi:uncharacterized membrane protein YhhN
MENINYYAFLIIIPFVVLLPFYFRAEKQENFNRSMAFKLSLSGLCTLCALLGFAFVSMPVDFSRILVIFALVCAFLGDYFLQYIMLDEKKFAIGILCFAGTQVFLIIFLCTRYGVSWPDFVMTAVVFFFVHLLTKKQRWELGRAMIPLYTYMVILIFMMSKAVLPLLGGYGVSLSMILMAAGGILFLLGDILLGTSAFKPGSGPLLYPKQSAYFCAILLIALSNFEMF